MTMTDYDRIEKVIRWLDARGEDQPRLSELARAAGLSESHFHRLFSRWAGITPKGFLKALAADRAKALLRSRSVLDAALESGLSGPGRLHDLMVSAEAVSPGEFKARGAGLTIRWDVRPSPFGPCLLALTGRGLCRLDFADGGHAAAERRLRRDWPKARLVRDPAAAAAAAERAFARRGKAKLLLAGTPFQLQVWRALLRVPPGRLVSYGELARAAGRPKAARAVGAAVGANRLAVLIPCHRVIRETGALGGYRWGLARKRAILAWEGAR